MRICALALGAAALFFTASASANTSTWTDQAMRLVFTAPQEWSIDQRVGLGMDDTQTFVAIGDETHLCQFNSDANWDTFSHSPGNVHRQVAAGISAETWTEALNGFPELFPNQSAEVESTTLDSTEFWPIQRAQARSERGMVIAAFQQRPGVDLVTACLVSDDAQREVYEDIIRSVSHPSDSILQSAVEAELLHQPAPATN